MAFVAMVKRAVLDPKQTLLDLLRQWRTDAGLSQVEMASRIGWQQSDVSKVERGIRRLDVLELRSWLIAMERPFGAFIDELDRKLSAQTALEARWARQPK